MSFSGKVKEELTKQNSKSRHCQLAELAGIIAMTGLVIPDNVLVREKFSVLMKRAFDIDIEKPFTAEDVNRVLAALKINQAVIFEGANEEVDGSVDGRLIQNTCCKRAFIRGAFLTSGSMSDPNKSYHFEIVCKTMGLAKQLRDAMNSFNTEAKIVERKNHYIVYLKEGSQIVDMLNVMEAYVSLMNLENVRILKEMRNSVNRKVNCETANISKTVNAAVKQLQDIELIRDTDGLESLPEQLEEMALVRLEFPEAALKELGNKLNPPVGKSGVNHRLRKIAEIADEIRNRGR